ncbi:hypothetical protein [uncultured Duncaniella sp.]|uniref:hypothetical protein n=2 Tax=uncultured Duncaniella sp. TaxID=2768039 RepID=UPI00261CAD13|nr:hypothetical protein [uncultured Duncaniella sp.]
METVVLIIMLMVSFNFALKLTYHKAVGITATCMLAALFVGLVWPYAASQSKTQITDWLNAPDLMLDTSVLLTVDVFFQITFCVMMAKKIAGEQLSVVQRAIYAVALWFPGLLIFPVLFALLVEIIFSFPGNDFSTLSWATATCVLIATPSLSYLIRFLLPEKDLRLELMFVVNAITAILGIIATVNGRTAVKGTNSVEWDALAGFLLIIAAGTVAGILVNRRSIRKTISKLQ